MRYLSSKCLSVIVGCIVCCPALVSAQEQSAIAVSTLRLGQLVRVQAPGIAVDGGMVTEIDTETLVVADQGQEWVIPVNALESLSVRRRTIFPSVFTFGALGLLGGFVVNKVLAESNSDAEGSNVLLVGVGIGAGLGLAIGLNKWSWNVIFPR